MASRDETINMVIKARDEASATLGTIQDRVLGLGGVVKGLGPAFATIGGAAIAGQIGAMTVELARTAAVSQQVESALGSLAANAGTSANAIVSAMDRAAMGTISQYELMLQANRALQFEVAKTPQELAKLVELATALGRATGRSDTDALNDLIAGISRESKLILDNLSLIIDIDKVTGAYAQTLGKTADQLSSYERKQAILNEAFRQGGPAIAANADAADSAATRFERMDASLANLKVALGELFSPAVGVAAQAVADAANALAKGAPAQPQSTPDELQQKIAGIKAEIEKVKAEADDWNFSDIFFANGDADQARIDALNSELSQLEHIMSTRVTAAAAAAADGVQTVGTASQYAAMEASYLGAAALNGANGLSQLEAFAWSTASSIDAATGAMARMNSIAGGLQSIRMQGIGQLESTMMNIAKHGGDTEQLAAQYGQAVDQIWNMSLAMDGTAESQFQNKLLVQQTLDPYNQQLDSIIESERATTRLAKATGGAGGAAQQLSQEFSNLQSKVSSVLSGALNLDVGVDTESILGRSDAINEDARRLADIAVKGFDSPWYGYFQDRFPALFQEFFAGADGSEGAKKQAAQMLKDFEDGLRPELINKDMAKERVKRMLIGEANTKAMADEIAKELAGELGISIQKAQAAAGAALGVSSAPADAVEGSTGGGVPVKVLPMIDQAALAPLTNLGQAITVPVTLELATPTADAIDAWLTSITVKPSVDVALYSSIENITIFKELINGIVSPKVNVGLVAPDDTALTAWTLGVEMNAISPNIATRLNTSPGLLSDWVLGVETNAPIPNIETRINTTIGQLTDWVVYVETNAPNPNVGVLLHTTFEEIQLFKDFVSANIIPTISPTFTVSEESKAQLSTLLAPSITPTVDLFGATGGAAVDFDTPGRTIAQLLSYSMVAEFAALNPGAVMVESLAASIADNYKQLGESGKNAGQQWGNFFMGAVSDSVPIPLIELLANLVTPAVREKFAQEASQRGATYSPLPS